MSGNEVPRQRDDETMRAVGPNPNTKFGSVVLDLIAEKQDAARRIAELQMQLDSDPYATIAELRQENAAQRAEIAALKLGATATKGVQNPGPQPSTTAIPEQRSSGNNSPASDTNTLATREAPDKRPELFGMLNRHIDAAPGNFGLVMLDLDGLTDINDSEGHPGGDRYLKYVRDLLRDLTRKPENANNRTPDEIFVVHINGDEFCVVLGGTSTQEQVGAFTKRLQDTLSEYGVEASMHGEVHTVDQTAQQLYAKVNAGLDIDKHAHRMSQYNQLPAHQQAIVRALGEVAAQIKVSPRTLAGYAMAAMDKEVLEAEKAKRAEKAREAREVLTS